MQPSNNISMPIEPSDPVLGSELSAPPSRINWAFWLALLAILAVASFIRLNALSQYPQRFVQDEMVLGYDAWSLWQTGRDHHGELLPVTFRSFNDYVPPTSIYVAVPFVGIFGLSETTTRLPFAVLGIATVYLVALLGRRWFGPLAGICAALFLAIDPWHVMYSRLAFPPSSMPFFTALGLYLFTLATLRLQQGDQAKTMRGLSPILVTRILFGLSALSFALLTLTYSTMKIQGPLLVLTCLIAAWKLLWRHRGTAILWLVIYAVLVSPLAIKQLTQWDAMQTRFQGISAFNNQDWFIQALRLYGDHYNPSALAFTGYGEGLPMRRPLYIGELFWLEVPLIVVGLWWLTRRSASRKAAFSLTALVFIWFLTFPIADSLTKGAPPFTDKTAGGPQEMRAYNIVPLPELLGGLGVAVVSRMIHRRLRYSRWRWLNPLAQGGLAATMGVLLIVFTVIFLSYFWGTPLLETKADPTDPAYPWNIGYEQIVTQAVNEMKACDTLWMPFGLQPYMHYLFYTHYPPQKVQQIPLNGVYSGWLEVNELDQIRVGIIDFANPLPTNKPECEGQPRRVFYLSRVSNDVDGWQERGVIRNAGGVIVWQLTAKALKYYSDDRINDGDTNATMVAYCTPDGGLDIHAVEGDPAKVQPSLFTLSADQISTAVQKAASTSQHQLIADKDGRQVWAQSYGKLQLHDARGVVYDYAFNPTHCNPKP
jgi:4-amino-4-deoxy-L-arabinose transferase-like glycosyltransferase